MADITAGADAQITLFAYRATKNKVVIKVADNGAGMPQEVIEKIFIPFFSTKKSESGIGQSLCKQIMMLHKGNIQIQSVEGKGSAFSLHFSLIHEITSLLLVLYLAFTFCNGKKLSALRVRSSEARKSNILKTNYKRFDTQEYDPSFSFIHSS